jgi:tetrahydromethanopterin S-methyltransferase subunit G
MTSSSLEERMARLEGSFEQIERRLSNIEQDIRAFRSDLNTRFYWLMGTMLGILIPMWVTIILAVLLQP